MGQSFLAMSIGLVANLSAFVLFRFLVARLLGAHGGWMTLALRSASRNIVRQRLAIAAVGPLGCYLTAGLFLAVGAAMGGRSTLDESSMRVTVFPGSPADVAGVQDGDRVVSVDGEAATDWDRLRAEVGSHKDESIQVVVERGGATLTLSPRLGKEGRMGVAPPRVTTQPGAVDCLGFLFVEPGRVEGIYFASLASTLAGEGPSGELTGPVGVLKQAGRTSSGLGVALSFVGTLNACWLWVAVVFALVLLPWPTRERREPA
jgi:regulator of sigma E protease